MHEHGGSSERPTTVAPRVPGCRRSLSCRLSICSRGGWPGVPGGSAAFGSCLRPRFLRSDALGLWRRAGCCLHPPSARGPCPSGRRPPSDVRHGSFTAAVLSRGSWPDSPGALGAGGFCLQAEVLRSDALRLWWQTAGSLGPERLRAPPAVGSYPPEPATIARDPSGAVAPWSSRPIRPEVWRLADTVCRRRFLRSDALRLGLRYVALPCLRASGDGSCPRG